MNLYAVVTDAGTRHWHADDEEHALEQHYDALVTEMVANDPEGYVWEVVEVNDEHDEDCPCGGLANAVE